VKRRDCIGARPPARADAIRDALLARSRFALCNAPDRWPPRRRDAVVQGQ
jgi:hypothetical protein